MGNFLKYVFFVVLVRPLVFIVMGLNIRHKERLPKNGPAILVANHNSHLDTMVLMSLVSPKLLPKVKPVAAADYFLPNPLLRWFSCCVIGIIPIQRTRKDVAVDPLSKVSDSLNNGDIVIFYPEGSRGEAEKMSEFKAGIAKLAERHPNVPVVPIYLNGLGKALPKCEGLLVPFFIDVFVGKTVSFHGDRGAFLSELKSAMLEDVPQTILQEGINENFHSHA